MQARIEAILAHPIIRWLRVICFPITAITAIVGSIWWITGYFVDPAAVMTDLADGFSARMTVLAEWPNHWSWEWSMAVLLILVVLLCGLWATNKIHRDEAATRQHETKITESLKSLLTDARTLPVLFAYRAVRFAETDEGLRSIADAADYLEELRKNVERLRGSEESIDPEFTLIRLGHKIARCMDTAVRRTRGLTRDDNPKFDPSNPFWEPATDGRRRQICLPSHNADFFNSVASFVQESDKRLQELNAHYGALQQERREIESAIEQEMKQLAGKK